MNPAELAHTGLDQTIDVADVATKAAVTAAQETQKVLGTGVESLARVGNKTTQELLAEVEVNRNQLIQSLRALADALGDAAKEILTGQH